MGGPARARLEKRVLRQADAVQRCDHSRDGAVAEGALGARLSRPGLLSTVAPPHLVVGGESTTAQQRQEDYRSDGPNEHCINTTLVRHV